MKKDNDFSKREHLYGKVVEMNNRGETIHIWSEKEAIKNAGKWTPYQITKAKHLFAFNHFWNYVKEIKSDDKYAPHDGLFSNCL